MPTDGNLNETSAAIGELRGQSAGLVRQMSDLDKKIDDHLEHVRFSLHEIRNGLNKIDGRLYLGEQRMNALDESIRKNGETAGLAHEALERHMEAEEATIEELKMQFVVHDERLQSVEKDVSLAKKLGKYITWLIGIGITGGSITIFGHTFKI